MQLTTAIQPAGVVGEPGMQPVAAAGRTPAIVGTGHPRLPDGTKLFYPLGPVRRPGLVAGLNEDTLATWGVGRCTTQIITVIS
jgi:hypothetical protein